MDGVGQVAHLGVKELILISCNYPFAPVVHTVFPCLLEMISWWEKELSCSFLVTLCGKMIILLCTVDRSIGNTVNASSSGLRLFNLYLEFITYNLYRCF
jgi:hypothetical protein